MQDRLNFKFWHKSYKKIFNITQIDFSLSLIMCNTDLGLEEYHISEGYLIQCTGLKDKNGKLIYEGDIIKITTDEKDEIVIKCYWNEKNMLFFGEILNKKGVCNHYCFKRDYLYYFLENNDYEILGNIYENPELLN